MFLIILTDELSIEQSRHYALWDLMLDLNIEVGCRSWFRLYYKYKSISRYCKYEISTLFLLTQVLISALVVLKILRQSFNWHVVEILQQFFSNTKNIFR